MKIFSRLAVLLFFFSTLAAPIFPAPAVKNTLSGKTPSEIYREEGKSVVEIVTDQGQGSGEVITPGGLIVTNYHVVQDARTAVARTIDGRTIPIEGIVEVDKTHDLALLKAESPTPFKPIPLGNSNDVRIGQKVIAIGNPEGYQNTVSEGLISGFRMSFGSIYWGFKLFQITAPISPGSSGGALLDVNGYLLGITSAGYVAEAENLNVAVPINYIKPMLPRDGKMFFIQRFAKNGEATPAGQISANFMEGYLYLTRQLLESAEDIIAAEQATIASEPLKPVAGFYETRARLSALGSLFNLGSSPTESSMESRIKFGLADVMIKLSECNEAFISAFEGGSNVSANVEQAKHALEQARGLLFEDVAITLGAQLPYGEADALLSLMEKHPLYFKGDLYYGIATVSGEKGSRLVLAVYPGSPADAAGVKEGDILTAPLDESPANAYKKQIVVLNDGGKTGPVSLSPIRFGFDVKPTVIGVRRLENESVSPEAPERLEMMTVAALDSIPGIYAVAIPQEDAHASIASDASKYGLDYVLGGNVSQYEVDSVYSLSPSQFEGYEVKLGTEITLYDPFGQPTSCCKPQQIDIHSAFQNGVDAYLTASQQLVQELVKEMNGAGIIKPGPTSETQKPQG